MVMMVMVMMVMVMVMVVASDGSGGRDGNCGGIAVTTVATNEIGSDSSDKRGRRGVRGKSSVRGRSSVRGSSSSSSSSSRIGHIEIWTFHTRIHNEVMWNRDEPPTKKKKVGHKEAHGSRDIRQMFNSSNPRSKHTTSHNPSKGLTESLCYSAGSIRTLQCACKINVCLTFCVPMVCECARQKRCCHLLCPCHFSNCEGSRAERDTVFDTEEKIRTCNKSKTFRSFLHVQGYSVNEVKDMAVTAMREICIDLLHSTPVREEDDAVVPDATPLALRIRQTPRNSDHNSDNGDDNGGLNGDDGNGDGNGSGK
jgi:hypothetical protein